MRYEGIAIFRGGKFRLLHFLNVVLHTLALGIGVCQVKHVEPHAVDTCQGDELELVAHIRQLLLEAGNSFVVEVFLPVERRRAVISQQFARIFRVDGLCKATRQFQIRRGGFTPYQVSIWRIRQATADRLLNARMSTEEAFTGTLAGNKFAVIRVAIGGDQIRRISIGTGNQQGWNARHVSCQTRRDQFLNSFLSWHQNFAAHVTAFLH